MLCCAKSGIERRKSELIFLARVFHGSFGHDLIHCQSRDRQATSPRNSTAKKNRLERHASASMSNHHDSDDNDHNNSLFRVLTVGEGDLSLSRALLRAYPQAPLDLIATTLIPDAETLRQTYPHTTNDNDDGTSTIPMTIHWGVDATLLHRRYHEQTFDAILFHHPHLGVFESEAEQATQHARLLAHYLWSASQCLRESKNPKNGDRTSQSFIHLCLCGNQAVTWQLDETCQRLGLQLDDPPQSTSLPFHQILIPPTNGENPQSLSIWEPAAPLNLTHHRRRQRYSKHVVNRHWLVKYGYQHQRTHGNLVKRSSNQVSLEGSLHYRIRTKTDHHGIPVAPVDPWSRILVAADDNDECVSSTSTTSSVQADKIQSFRCNICNALFDNQHALRVHLQCPAVPQLPLEESSPSREHEDMSTLEKNTQASTTREAPAECEQSKQGVSPNNNQTNKVTHGTVGENQLRLRKYVQLHCRKSKNQANRLVTQGFVTLNGEVVTDTARLVSLLTDTVRIVENDATEHELCTHHADQGLVDAGKKADACHMILGGIDIAIKARWSVRGIPNTLEDPLSLVVVWKPVGVRTLGHVGTGSTLESLVTRQLKEENQPQPQSHQQQPFLNNYHSWTRLDTGCSGVCLMARDITLDQQEAESMFSLTHTFTMLVHGHWKDVEHEQDSFHAQIPLHYIQRWKKRKRPQGVQENGEEQQPGNGTNDAECKEKSLSSTSPAISARFRVVEKTTRSESIPVLSTLQMEVDGSPPSGIASLISFYLRHDHGLRVVGDRFSRKEDAQYLTRSMRNRIKQKLCLGCLQIDVQRVDDGRADGQKFSFAEPIPEKWSAEYWESFLLNGKDS